MDYRLLVLDIDGTVTNSQKEVTEKTRKAILRLQEKGIRVAIASGRHPRGVLSVARILQLHQFGNFILAFNGAKIIDVRQKKCIYERTLPAHLPARLWKDVQQCGLGILTYTNDTLIAGTKPDRYMELESQISQIPVEYHEDFCRRVNFPVNGCLITGPPEDIEAMEPVFSCRYFHETQIFRSEPCFLEVVPKNVDKAYSLKHLLAILGITREEMVCCGDSFNDISMLRYAGLGVAMANAQNEVKDVANYITKRDNDHDGIAEVIERFFPDGGK